MRGLNLPPVTRAAILALCFCSLLVFILRYSSYHKLVAIATAPQVQPENDSRPVAKPAMPIFRDIVVPYLTIVPSLSYYYPWVLVTATFSETSLIAFAVTGATLVYGGKYCERVWSSKELTRFLLIVAVSTNVLAYLTALIQYMIASAVMPKASDSNNQTDVSKSGPNAFLFQVINGGVSLQLAFLVALKQLVPEHSIVLFKMLTVKVKHLAMPALIFYTTIGAIYYKDLPFVTLVWSGFFVAWIYLRFYRYTYVDPILPAAQQQPGQSATSVSMKPAPGKTRIRGDASEIFSLANFFYPSFIRDLVQAISRVVFRILVTIKICTPFGQDEIEQGNLRANLRTGSSSNSGNSNAASREAERRRALAMKVLDERLKQENPS